jgi:hypothetical protein
MPWLRRRKLRDFRSLGSILPLPPSARKGLGQNPRRRAQEIISASIVPATRCTQQAACAGGL